MHLIYVLFLGTLIKFLKGRLPNGNVLDKPWTDWLKTKIIPEDTRSNNEHFDDERIENVKEPVVRRGSQFFTRAYWLRL